MKASKHAVTLTYTTNQPNKKEPKIKQLCYCRPGCVAEGGMKHDNGGNPSEGNGMVAGDDDDAQESCSLRSSYRVI